MCKTFLPLITMLALLALPACKPKTLPSSEKPPAEHNETSATTEATADVPTAQETQITPSERAAKLGFACYLPADTRSLISIHNGLGAVERIKQSKLSQIFSELSDSTADDEEEIEVLEAEQDPQEPEPDAVENDQNEEGPSRILGREITIAFGKDTERQTANLVTLSNRLNYHRIRAAITALADSIDDGDFDPNLFLDVMNDEEVFISLLKDPEAGPTLLTAMNMPPTYAAFLSNPEHKEEDLATISGGLGMLAMFGEVVTEIELEVGGFDFKGYKIAGEVVSRMITENREQMTDSMDAATFDQLVAAIAEKNLVILTGLVDDYVVVFLGASEEELQLATSPEKSLLAGDAMAFADSALSKDLFTVIYGSDELISGIAGLSGGFGVIADAVRDGLAGTDSLGDTRDIVALLQVVADKESAYMKMMQPSATGSVSYFDDGLVIESFGGIDAGAIDWEQENSLGSLGGNDQVFLFANLSTSAQFEQALSEYYEAILETVYAIGMKVAEKGQKVEKLQGFNQGIQMFDTMFRAELLTMWNAFTVDMEQGLGRERAWVVDFKGAVPAIPGIPQPFVDKGKFPRISVVAPVVDRGKLASSWDTIHDSASRTLGKVNEMMDQNLPMQKPMSSDSSGITTWFFALPFFNDDFLPSVTLDDQWFSVGTSKSQSLDLIGKAAKSTTKSKGAVMEINFNALQGYLKEMMPMVEENSKAWGLSKDDLSQITRIPDLLGEFDRLRIHTRKEGDTVRTTIHFKTH